MGDDEADDGRNWVLIALVVVVGMVFLLVAAVIGAAIVGSFVLGVGEEASSTEPAVSFEFETTDGGVEITHAGGDSVPASDLRIEVDGEDRGTWADLRDSSGRVEAEDSIAVSDVSADQTVTVVWESDGESAEIARYRA